MHAFDANSVHFRCCRIDPLPYFGTTNRPFLSSRPSLVRFENSNSTGSRGNNRPMKPPSMGNQRQDNEELPRSCPFWHFFMSVPYLRAIRLSRYLFDISPKILRFYRHFRDANLSSCLEGCSFVGFPRSCQKVAEELPKKVFLVGSLAVPRRNAYRGRSHGNGVDETSLRPPRKNID